VTWGIPSGQAIAAELRVAPLTSDDLSDIKPHGLADSTPLWFYILKEAQLQHGGLQLGDVGADIVGRVFVGMCSSTAIRTSRTPRVGDRRCPTGTAASPAGSR